MSTYSATAPSEQGRTIKIDTEHFSVRFLVPIIMLGSAIIFHFVALRALEGAVDGVSPFCIVLPLDALVLFGAGYGAERVLKRLLPSQRGAKLTDQALVVTDARKSPPSVTAFEWDQTVNAAAWRFPIRQRTRVPKGWFCMAVQLVQDEKEFIFYTFKSPKAAEETDHYDRFVRLRPRKETESSTDLRAAAEQRRLLKLEDARWADGAEVSPEDFDAILGAVARHASGW